MGKVFAYDSPVWKFMGRIADFFVLTMLWLVTSLPIFTIGVSTTTVYYITLKMAEDKEEYLVPMYFKTFKKVFKDALRNSLLLLVVGVVLATDIFICYQYRTPAAIMLFAAFTVIGILYLMIVTFYFPIMARTNNTTGGFLKASFYLAIRYISWSVLLVVIPFCIFTVAIFVFWPLLFFAVGLSAYLQSLIFCPIFKRQGWSLA